MLGYESIWLHKVNVSHNHFHMSERRTVAKRAVGSIDFSSGFGGIYAGVNERTAVVSLNPPTDMWTCAWP